MEDAQAIWSRIDANANEEEPRDLLATIYYLADRSWICLDNVVLGRLTPLYVPQIHDGSRVLQALEQGRHQVVDRGRLRAVQPVLNAAREVCAQRGQSSGTLDTPDVIAALSYVSACP